MKILYVAFELLGKWPAAHFTISRAFGTPRVGQVAMAVPVHARSDMPRPVAYIGFYRNKTETSDGPVFAMKKTHAS
jgi:hypothetical protein